MSLDVNKQAVMTIFDIFFNAGFTFKAHRTLTIEPFLLRPYFGVCAYDINMEKLLM